MLTRDCEQCILRRSCLLVDQIHDDALMLADDGLMRRRSKVAHGGRMPVVAPRHGCGRIHALLHNGPIAVARDDEAVQIKLEAIGHRVVVYASGESTGASESVAVQTDAPGDVAQLVRRLAGVATASTTHPDAQLVRAWVQAALQRSEDR